MFSQVSVTFSCLSKTTPPPLCVHVPLPSGNDHIQKLQHNLRQHSLSLISSVTVGCGGAQAIHGELSMWWSWQEQPFGSFAPPFFSWFLWSVTGRWSQGAWPPLWGWPFGEQMSPWLMCSSLGNWIDQNYSCNIKVRKITYRWTLTIALFWGEPTQRKDTSTRKCYQGGCYPRTYLYLFKHSKGWKRDQLKALSPSR